MAAELKKKEQESFELSQLRIQYDVLSRQADQSKLLYNVVLQRMKETDLTSKDKAQNMRVVDTAVVPRSPVKPRVVLTLFLGLLGGLGVAIGLAFFVNYLDDSIKSQDDIETYLRLPFLGYIPNIKTNSETTALMAAAGVNWVFFQTFDEGPERLLEAVKLCVELGQNVNAANSMGLTAVMGAANRGSDDIIQFLAGKGAKLDVKDKEGRTPLDWAHGVFLATNPAKPKPASVELIQKIMGTAPGAR